MSEIIKKEFASLEEEMKWLDEMGEKNMLLLGYNAGEYEFELGEEPYVYRVENLGEILKLGKFKDKNAYIKFLNQRNIEIVAESEDKIYLRRKKAETQPSKPKKIAKTNEKASSKKSTLYYILGASQLALALKFILDTVNSAGAMGTKFFLSLALSVIFIITGMVFMIAGVQFGRRQ